jgi:hypothetical protein
MCYTYPGPRCSSYAARVLTEAKIRARTEPGSIEAREAVDAAQLEYDATPAGMRELKRRIAQYQGTAKTEYELRLALGEAKRDERLLLIKAKDRGDINHQKSQPQDIMFPASFHQFCDGDYAEEKLIGHDSEEIKQLVADSHQWISKLNDEEIEAVSWYTSNGSTVINKHLTGNSDEFYLRDYIEDETAEEFDEREAKAAQEHLNYLNTTVKDLDSALAKGKRQTFIKVYRGVSGDVMRAEGYGSRDTDKYVAERFTVGGTFISPVFMSSSLEYKRGAGFETSGVVLEVLGKTVGPVSNVSAWGVAEKEYVLPRNTAYKVKAVKTVPDQHGDNRFIIQLEEE